MEGGGDQGARKTHKQQKQPVMKTPPPNIPMPASKPHHHTAQECGRGVYFWIMQRGYCTKKQQSVLGTDQIPFATDHIAV